MKKLFKKVALMVIALLTLSVGTSTVKEVKAAEGDITFNINYSDGYNEGYGSSGTSGSLSVKDSTDANTMNYTYSGINTKSSNGSVYSYTMYVKNSGYIYSTSLVDGYFPSSVTVSFSSNTGVSGKIITSFDSSIISERNTTGTVSPTKGGTYTVTNSDMSKLYWNFSTTSANVQVTNITIVYSSLSTPSISISGDEYIQVGESTELTATLSNISGDINWTSSDNTVATVENGKVTALSMGTTTITANVDGIEGTFDFTVYPKAESELTISEAIRVCELTGTTNAPYVYSTTGTIKTIDTAYDSSYNNITVTITDGTNDIIAYRMIGGEELVVNDIIKVTGTLVNYGGNTPEFIAECTYEVVEDTTVATILESLNNVNAYMSLAYQYKETIESNNIVTDKLTRDTTGITGTTYTEWSEKTLTSDAVFAGQSAGGNSSIQLRSSNSNSGVVTTTSGGKVKKITIEWNENTATGRTLNVYGSNTAYTKPTDLYNDSTDGDFLDTIVYGTSTELIITGDYQYIGFRSNSGAMYLTSVSIEWETTEFKEVKTMSDSTFLIRFGIDSSIANIGNIATIDSYGITVSANGNTAYYDDSALSWELITYTDANNTINYYSVVINLGDIINDTTKLTTEFTVTAFAEYNGVKYISELSKTYSVVDMVNKYKTEEIADVDHLYNYFVEKGLIVEGA